MPQSLLIAVRFHEGRYHGQGGSVRRRGRVATVSRPPVFKRFVAGAARGATLRAEDRRALEWLERLDPPRIAAPAIRRGRAVRAVRAEQRPGLGRRRSCAGGRDSGRETMATVLFRSGSSGSVRMALRVRRSGSGARLFHRDTAVSTWTWHRHGLGIGPGSG